MCSLRFRHLLISFTFLFTKLPFSVSLTGLKYYDRLDISQDADEATIKRAYKKLAYKWHPDRNPENQEKANKKFMEVAEAYEVLSDADKRRQYDQLGDDAFSANAGSGGFHQGGQRFHFSDPSHVFSWVFGEGGGAGGNFEFDFGDMFGGGGGGHRHQRHQPEEEFYKDDPYVLTLTDENFEEDSLGWIRLVEFYAPWCGHCKSLSSKWKTLAKSLQGVIKVAAVNCDKHQRLCEIHGVTGYPTIKAFVSTNVKSEKDFHGERSVKALEKWAISLIPHNVANVSNKRKMEEVLKRCMAGRGQDKASWKVCVFLFTEKKETSALYKSLSFMYKDRIAFAEVTGKSSIFDSQFNVTSRPSMFAVCNGELRTIELFQKKMNPDRIRTFLNTFAGGRKCNKAIIINSEQDVDLLTAAQLREILREKGVDCEGCVEKSDYVKRVKEVI
eukprot:g2916.t1